MACEQTVMQSEAEYFHALGEAARLALADGALVLFDEDGAELLRFAAPTHNHPRSKSWS